MVCEIRGFFFAGENVAHAIFLCLKYFGKRRMALFGMAAVGLCVGLLIVVTSLFTGFIDSYQRHARELMGEVALQTPGPLADWGGLAAAIEAHPSVRRAEPVVQTGGLLYLRRGDVRGVKISGVELAEQLKQPAFREGLVWPAGAAREVELTGAARERARGWLRGRLGREPREAEMPTPTVVGIGVLGEPDELTDE